jgi:peptidoglycan hydrolase CwlO-like protein
MNSPITFSPAESTFRVVRPAADNWAATLAEERRRLQEDHEALREREQNLREYESRLRALQADIEAGREAPAAGASPTRSTAPGFLRPSSRTPFADDPGLQTAWEKLHRARELFEAESRSMRDDRVALREQEAQIKRRETALAEREARIAAREAALLAPPPPPPSPEPASPPEEPAVSAVSRLTRGPFSAARAVFGPRK